MRVDAAQPRAGDGRVRFGQGLNPRLHLAAAIGWAVFTVVTLAALVAADLAASEAARRVRADSERLLTQFAAQIGHALKTDLRTRRAILRATAAQIVATDDRSEQALRRHLDAAQAHFPEFVWLAVADVHGRITAAAGGAREGDDVSASAWFARGRTGLYLGDVHPAPPLLPSPDAAADPQAPRVIDLAVPLTDAAGRPAGVLGAELSWRWVENLQAELLRSLDSQRQLDMVLTTEDGTVVVGPAAWLGHPRPTRAEISQDGAYLIGGLVEHAGAGDGLGWGVVVRQDAHAALAPSRATRQVVFLSVLLAGLVAAAAAVWATRLLTRRLSALAEEAVAVRQGELHTLALPAGDDEVSRIGATLAELVDHLQQEKKALQTLNAELDARVVERTARVERLADDARHAAVTRERLRLARDLHDTLAHSLMALLTQIRMVRKLRTRWSEHELEAELAQAQEVAASGLTEARAAIAQMRHNGVRDTGLGPALQELLTHFCERTGVAATLQADPDAAGLADERAETVFRIAEEALHNVERHAHAHLLTLRLGAAPAPTRSPPGADAVPRVRMEITDDGVGFDPAQRKPGHYGLRGIEEQAALIGAHLEVSSQVGQGTRVVAEFDA